MISINDLIDEIEDTKEIFGSSSFCAINTAVKSLEADNLEKAVPYLEMVLFKNHTKPLEDIVNNWIYVIKKTREEGYLFYEGEFTSFKELVDSKKITIDKAVNSICDIKVLLKGRLYIPFDIEALEVQAFLGSFLNEVVLNENIKRIGEQAFCNSHLKKITIPESIDFIPRACFRDCISLSEVNFPKGLRSIESDAFRNCPSLEKISLSEKIEKFGDCCFLNCRNLKVVNFKATNLHLIESCAFKNCEKLREFTIGNAKYQKIEHQAFEFCEDLVIKAISDNFTCYRDCFKGIKQFKKCYKDSRWGE